jgi:hypothetical protein
MTALEMAGTALGAVMVFQLHAQIWRNMSETIHDAPSGHLPGQRPLFKVVSHSSLFYWWPVWVLGFVIVAISYASGTRLAVVPEGSTFKAVAGGGVPEAFVLTLPGKPTMSLRNAAAVPTGKQAFPYRMARFTSVHLIYAVVLLAVILASTVTLRGLWSVVNLMAILLVALLFELFGWWGTIIKDLGGLHLYISTAAYFFTSLVLCLYWLAAVFVFDQRRFIVFSPGQLIVHREIGDQKAVYDTGGVNVVKRRNDFIRHRLLGFGAGDLVVSTADGRHEFELPNVLFADAKIREIAETMKTRPVVTE